MEELVLDCVIPYIQDIDVLNSVSLVSRKYLDIDSLTRKHLTVHVHYLPNPSRLSLRFPNLESLTLKSYPHGRGYETAEKCRISGTPWIKIAETAEKYRILVTPWIKIAVKFERLNSLSIRNMVVYPSDLQLLAGTRGANLRSLDICGCKMFSEEGLVYIARYCIDLRSLRLEYNSVENDYNINGKWLHEYDYSIHGKWLHELALHNTVMESLSFHIPFDLYDIKDVARLANKCSKSLVSLNIFPQCLSDFKKVFKHAKKLDHFGYGIIDEDWDYSGFKFPPNIHGLRLEDVNTASFPFLLPYLNQLRELNLECRNIESNCQCSLFEKCSSLEVLHTEDICGDKGLRVIGQFCKKLRKLVHDMRMTHMGLIALAQGCPNLEYLDVSVSDISNEALECVGTHLKNLRDLRMWLCIKVGITDSLLDNGVRAMLMGCSKLERLDITLVCGGVTDVGLGYIGKYGNSLRHLYLSNAGESDLGLLELSKGCPKLRKLILEVCPFSEQAITTFVFNNNHSLRYIRVESDSHDDLVLTRPNVSAEVLTELTELYVTLAEKLHRLAVQLVADGSGAGSVKITCTSSRATNDLDTPLVRNLVARGIRNKERLVLDGSSEKPLEIRVQIAKVESRFAIAGSEFGKIKLQGRVKDGVPHLTKVGAFEVDVSLEGNIILCRLVDQGNTISRVTSILGEENASINFMSVGRPVMVVGIDKKLSEEGLKKIDEIPGVEEFVFLAVNGDY